jgi:predicted ester cyclase
VAAFDRQSDVNTTLHPENERRQSLRGFDDEYVDIVDYIVRCTYKIWEQHGIGLIYGHYTHNAVQHGTDGVWYGRDQVIANTIQMQAAFPDLRLIADDVVWTGDDVEGFKTSHRCTLVGRNTGYSVFGAPTGRRIALRSVYNCAVRENRIYAEWAFNDELSLIRQLGLPLRETVKKLTPAPLDSLGSDTVGQVERVRGQTTPDALPPATASKLDSVDVEDLVRRSMHEIWNWRLLNKVDDYYGENYLYHGATGRETYGRGITKRMCCRCWRCSPMRPCTSTTCVGTGTSARAIGRPCDGPFGDAHGTGDLWGADRPADPDERHYPAPRPRRTLCREWTLFNELQILQHLWSGR